MRGCPDALTTRAGTFDKTANRARNAGESVVVRGSVAPTQSFLTQRCGLTTRTTPPRSTTKRRKEVSFLLRRRTVCFECSQKGASVRHCNAPDVCRTRKGIAEKAQTLSFQCPELRILTNGDKTHRQSGLAGILSGHQPTVTAEAHGGAADGKDKGHCPIRERDRSSLAVALCRVVIRSCDQPTASARGNSSAWRPQIVGGESRGQQSRRQRDGRQEPVSRKPLAFFPIMSTFTLA